MNLVGQRIGAYQIEKSLSQEGTSLVYLARDIRTNNKVALKLLRLEQSMDPTKIMQFQHEAQGGTKLTHPHIIPVYEVGSADGYYYIAMRYASGGSVENWIKQQGALSLETSVRIIGQIASALDFAHQRGVIHRDIKPSNILLSRDRETAFLADFGVAHIAGQQTVTDKGTLVGTPEFMSPEQIRGDKIDSRADIYSLGITLYFMLTGHLPFQGDPASVLYHQVHTIPRSPRQLLPRLPARVSRIVQKALAKKPEKRYQTAMSLSHDLQSFVRPGGVSWRTGAAIGLAAVLIFLLAVFSRSTVLPVSSSASTMPTLANATSSTHTPSPSSLYLAAPTSTRARILATPVTTLPSPVSFPAAVATVTRATTPASGIVTLPFTTVTPSSTPSVNSGQPAPLQTVRAVNTISLTFPASGIYIPRDRAVQKFEWKWEGELADNEHFEIRFYQEGVEGYQAPFAHRKEQSHEIDLNNLQGRGAFSWSITIVQEKNGRWERDIAESERRTIIWEGP